jgi:hypothetical protein
MIKPKNALDGLRVSSYNVRTVFDIVDKSNPSVACILAAKASLYAPAPTHA